MTIVAYAALGTLVTIGAVTGYLGYQLWNRKD